MGIVSSPHFSIYSPMKIPDKFKDDYLCMLSVFDHIGEVAVIDKEIRRMKNGDLDVSAQRRHLENELMDLRLLLDAHFENIDGATIEKQRIARFAEKNHGNPANSK